MIQGEAMLKIMKKLFLVISIIFSLQSFAQSEDICMTQGDFVPWPWSEQFYSQIVDKKWSIVNNDGKVERFLEIKKIKTFNGPNPYFNLMTYDENGEELQFGFAVSDFESKDLTFTIFDMNYKVRESMKINIGQWVAKNEPPAPDESDYPDFIPPQDILFPKEPAKVQQCEALEAGVSLPGLIIDTYYDDDQREAKRTWGVLSN